MKTGFEKLNDQEMINVVGGDRVLKIIDKDGNVIYIIVKEGKPVDEDEENINP
ncbi:MAG: bacteriocin [Bacteroidales bacterium]|nr:bacteriocin [Bacteroidales bacterium]